jgi:hypothetical protein
MNVKKLLFIITIALAGAILIYACGGGDGGPSGTGMVYLYATDDFMDGYMSVSLVVRSVALLNTGSGSYCEVLAGPVKLDVPELEGVLSLLDVTQCPAVPYNRIRVALQKGVKLRDASGKSSDCSLASYKDEHMRPNALNCTGDLCTLDITGEVNVFAFQGNMLGLDFDLKEFEVEHFGQPRCSVTMKVSPLHADDMDDMDGYEEEVSGYITSLHTGADLFTITKKGMVFTVDYSGASYKGAPQPGLDGLLSFAFLHNLEVEVRCATGCTGPSITAAKVYVEAKGSVSGLNTMSYTFTLVNTAKGFSVGVDYTEAVDRSHVEGPLAEGARVEAELFGHDGTNYLAREVEVEDTGGI